MLFVVDASVVLAWVMPDEQNPYADDLAVNLGADEICAPHHWQLEVANTLVGAERKGRLSSLDREAACVAIANLPLETDGDSKGFAFTDTLHLARKHNLTTYDAAYLELAIRRKLPIATLDQELRKAAAAEQVALAGNLP